MTTALFDTQFGINIGPWELGDLVPCLTRLTKLGYNGIEVTHRTYNSFGDRVEIFNEITQDVGIEVVSYVLKMDFDEVATNAALLDHFTHLAGFIHAFLPLRIFMSLKWMMRTASRYFFRNWSGCTPICMKSQMSKQIRQPRG